MYYVCASAEQLPFQVICKQPIDCYWTNFERITEASWIYSWFVYPYRITKKKKTNLIGFGRFITIYYLCNENMYDFEMCIVYVMQKLFWLPFIIYLLIGRLSATLASVILCCLFINHCMVSRKTYTISFACIRWQFPLNLSMGRIKYSYSKPVSESTEYIWSIDQTQVCQFMIQISKWMLRCVRATHRNWYRKW